MYDRAIHDTIATLSLHGVFRRHPNLKVASVENGSSWVFTLVKRLRKLANQHPDAFDEDPLDTLRRHVWITPYCEEDVEALAELVDIDRVMFGSDWPNGEGLADPLSFEEVLEAGIHMTPYCARSRPGRMDGQLMRRLPLRRDARGSAGNARVPVTRALPGLPVLMAAIVRSGVHQRGSSPNDVAGVLHILVGCARCLVWCVAS